VLAAVALLARPAQAQESTITIGTAQALEAAAAGFTFGLTERTTGSRCFTVSGQNNGSGTWGRAVSELLNAYLQSVCRHTGFGARALQNGWRVLSVSTTQSCQYDNFGSWTTLAASQCSFDIRTTPVVGSTSPYFQADVTIRGGAPQGRRATLTWAIQIRGPTGKSPWTLQSPSKPTLASPAADARVTTGTADFSWSAPLTGATSYRLCISRESYTGACEQRYSGTARQAPSITVPSRGERVRWYVEACNSIGCTASDSRIILNTLPSATLVSPPAGSNAGNRRPTFEWQTVAGAQTYELYVYHPQPLQRFSVPSLSSNVTEFTPASPLAMESPVYWMVNACTPAVGCGTPAGSDQVRVLHLVSFANELAPAFKHARCKNCHAVAATNFAPGAIGGGLPSGHAAVNGATNCAQANCHVSSLLPSEGSINPGWHAAPSGMDFRSKTDLQLCEMAKNPGSTASTALAHLTQDKLILWAVDKATMPGGGTAEKAPPQNLTTWRTRVERWVAANMPCN
jgi:hypothetical protein